jgi:hypothetical protein
MLVRQEVIVNQLPGHLADPDRILENIEYSKELSYNPHNEYYLLSKALPVLTRDVLNSNQAYLAYHLLPLAARSVGLESGYWQWYALSRLYHLTGDEARAQSAIDEAIRRQPTFEPAWVFKHYLNMVAASRKTGRPLESFSSEEPAVMEIPARGH